ncbi:LPS export ABC transporter periplasmic protein LptC [Kiritimatiellota bacterium B12222]|nr:LPS export ABC transporter periplasmic protein LptC [Kiritimatiellota bacterium B12222]
MAQICFLFRSLSRGSRGFILGWVFVAAGLLHAQTDVGRFKVPDVDEDGVLKSILTGESAQMFIGKPMAIQGLVVEFFEEDGKTVKMRITSPGCDYNTQTNSAESDKLIHIDGDGFHIEGVGYVFEASRSQMELKSDVKVVFNNVEFKPVRPQPESTP